MSWDMTDYLKDDEAIATFRELRSVIHAHEVIFAHDVLTDAVFFGLR